MSRAFRPTDSRDSRLCNVLTEALAPAMDIRVETIDIPVTGGEIVHGTADFPRDGANLDRGAIAVIRVPQPGVTLRAGRGHRL